MHNNLLGLFLILAHLASCVFVVFFHTKVSAYMKKYMYIFMLVLPFVGPVCIYAFLNMVKNRKYHSKFQNEEDEADRVIEDEKIRDEIQEVSSLVPLSDALVMNDSSVRRKMILDIINDNPEANLGLIKEASLNDDTEVVHYATTIISEISAKYEKEVKQARMEYESHPEDEEKLYAYCSLLKRYLEKNLVFGELEKMTRREYSHVLKAKLQFKTSIKVLSRIVENEIYLTDFAEAKKYLDILRENYPNEEQTWVLGFKYLCKQNKICEARELAREAGQKRIYFSTKNKAYMHFFLLDEDYQDLTVA